jgi:hypothetical protein
VIQPDPHGADRSVRRDHGEIAEEQEEERDGQRFDVGALGQRDEELTAPDQQNGPRQRAEEQSQVHRGEPSHASSVVFGIGDAWSAKGCTR